MGFLTMINTSKTVQPIKSLADIGKIKNYLLKTEQHRNYMLFIMGINIGLRISDLLSLKISDVWADGKCHSAIEITEQKTKKHRKIAINGAVEFSINKYLNSLKSFNENDWLFSSRKHNQALTKQSAHRLINQIMADCNINGHWGTHTLRKTFAYQLYMNNSENPLILPYLMKLLNHSSQSMTLRYIGIEQQELNNLVENLNL